MITLRKGKFIKIIALLLVCSFLLQQSALAVVADLREEGRIKATNVLLAIVSGAAQGLSVKPGWSLARNFASTYLIPLAINQVAKHIDNSVARFAFSAGASVAANMALDKWGGSVLGKGKGPSGPKPAPKPKPGVWGKVVYVLTKRSQAPQQLASHASKTFIQTLLSRLNNFFESLIGKLRAALSKIWNKITGKGKGTVADPGVVVPPKKPPLKVEEINPYTGEVIPAAANSLTKEIAKEALKEVPKHLPFWMAILIKSTQAAVYAAVEQAVYQNLNDSHKQLAEMIASASSMFVAELVGVGLEKAAGGHFIIYKGDIIAEKITDGTLNQELNRELKKFFADFGIAMAGRGVEVLFAEKFGIEEEGILASVGITSLLQQARQKRALEELKGERDKNIQRKEELETQLAIENTTSTRSRAPELQAEIDALGKRIGEYKYQISEAEKGYTRALLEGLLRGGISVGLQKISLATPSPLHGAYFNITAASIVEAALSKRPFAEVLSENIAKVTADVYSMGRAQPYVNDKGELELRKVNPNDIFFIARYTDYIRSVAEEDNITWPLEEQLISSLHYQTAGVIQDTLHHLAYKARMAKTSPWVRDIERFSADRPSAKEIKEAVKDLREALNTLKTADPEFLEQFKKGLLERILLGQSVYDLKALRNEIKKQVDMELELESQGHKPVESVAAKPPTMAEAVKIIEALDRYIDVYSRLRTPSNQPRIVSLRLNKAQLQEDNPAVQGVIKEARAVELEKEKEKSHKLASETAAQEGLDTIKAQTKDLKQLLLSRKDSQLTQDQINKMGVEEVWERSYGKEKGREEIGKAYNEAYDHAYEQIKRDYMIEAERRLGQPTNIVVYKDFFGNKGIESHWEPIVPTTNEPPPTTAKVDSPVFKFDRKRNFNTFDAALKSLNSPQVVIPQVPGAPALPDSKSPTSVDSFMFDSVRKFKSFSDAQKNAAAFERTWQQQLEPKRNRNNKTGLIENLLGVFK